MNWKEFFKPSVGKIVLGVGLFILLFSLSFLVVAFLYSYSRIGPRLLCVGSCIIKFQLAIVLLLATGNIIISYPLSCFLISISYNLRRTTRRYTQIQPATARELPEPKVFSHTLRKIIEVILIGIIGFAMFYAPILLQWAFFPVMTPIILFIGGYTVGFLSKMAGWLSGVILGISYSLGFFSLFVLLHSAIGGPASQSTARDILILIGGIIIAGIGGYMGKRKRDNRVSHAP